mgnify:CR=1 FL=1
MRIHAFVDAENISERLFFEGCRELEKQHDLFQIDVFGKTLPSWADGYNFVPCFFGKNSADTFMTAAIVRAVYEEPCTEGFTIFSHDRDFIPAIKVVTDNKKRAILVTEQNMKEVYLKHIAVDMTYFDNVEIDLTIQKGCQHISLPLGEIKRLKAYQMTTCFLKTKQGLFEVPFANGIDIHTFCRIIPLKEIRKGYGKNKRMRDILAESHLKVIDDKVYIDTENL